MPTLAAVLVVALTASLGNWQLRRADEKRASHARAERAAAQPAITMPRVPAPAAALDGRRVLVRGEYEPERTVFIDNRTHNGIAGFHVVSPIRIEGSALRVLVLRGWIARDAHDRARLPDLVTPSGVVEVEGVAESALQPSLELRKSEPPGPADRIWQNLSIAAYASWSGEALQPVLLRQLPSAAPTDGLVREWRDGGGDVDRHLGYAFQWFVMATITAGLWVWFTFLRKRVESSENP